MVYTVIFRPNFLGSISDLKGGITSFWDDLFVCEEVSDKLYEERKRLVLRSSVHVVMNMKSCIPSIIPSSFMSYI